jgi:hypothetical protein
MTLAVHYYHDVHKKFPPATGTDASIPGGNRSLSVHLLLYVEQMPLYQQYIITNNVSPITVHQFHTSLDFTTPDGIGVQNFAGNVRVFTDVGIKTPFDEPVVGLHAGNGSCSATFKDTFTDGSSNTIMFATRHANGGAITGDGNVSCSAYDAWVGANNSAFFGVELLSGRPSTTSSGGWQLTPTLAEVNCKFGATAHSFGGGLQIGLVDASIRIVYPNLSAFTWNTAMQPNDGNAPGSDW